MNAAEMKTTNLCPVSQHAVSVPWLETEGIRAEETREEGAAKVGQWGIRRGSLIFDAFFGLKWMLLWGRNQDHKGELFSKIKIVRWVVCSVNPGLILPWFIN